VKPSFTGHWTSFCQLINVLFPYYKSSNTTKKLMLQGYDESRLKSPFCKFYGRYNDLVCNYKYHWLICWMICFILFVRLLFPYWRWQRVIPYTFFRLRRTAGVTGQQKMLTPPWHPILPSHLSEVRAALHSILHLPFGLWLRFTHC
jgi:hypothetical protein